MPRRRSTTSSARARRPKKKPPEAIARMEKVVPTRGSNPNQVQQPAGRQQQAGGGGGEELRASARGTAAQGHDRGGRPGRRDWRGGCPPRSAPRSRRLSGDSTGMGNRGIRVPGRPSVPRSRRRRPRIDRNGKPSRILTERPVPRAAGPTSIFPARGPRIEANSTAAIARATAQRSASDLSAMRRRPNPGGEIP